MPSTVLSIVESLKSAAFTLSSLSINYLGDKNANTLTGTSKDEIFVAGAGDDTLTGNGGSTVLSIVESLKSAAFTLSSLSPNTLRILVLAQATTP
jgi:Ca2+-binding RTX toxin-like protein